MQMPKSRVLPVANKAVCILLIYQNDYNYEYHHQHRCRLPL